MQYNPLCFVALLLWAYEACGAMVSPFDYTSVYAPSSMYRISYLATLTQSSQNISIPYPKSFSAPPIILHSVSAMAFSKGLKFSISLMQNTTTAVIASLQSDSTLSKISFLFMVMDSTLYSANFSYFSYSMPNGVSSSQIIAITGNQDYDAAFLVGMQVTLGPFPSGYAPQVDSFVLRDSSNIISANLSFTFDPSQIAIKSLSIYFVDFQVSSFKAMPYAGSAMQFAIFGTNGVSTDTTQTGSYINSYSNSYFVGLQAFYDGQFLLGTLSFDIVAMLNTNVYYYVSELLFVAYKCPSSYPYTTPARSYCYNECQAGFYGDNQYICQPCDANCKTCFNQSTNCTSCQSPFVVTYGFVCGCKENTYQATYSNGTVACLSCSVAITGCLGCSSQTNCTKCMSNLILTSPIACTCPVGTTLTSLGSLMACVLPVVSVAEACPSGMIQNASTCTCPSFLNLTFANGICS